MSVESPVSPEGGSPFFEISIVGDGPGRRLVLAGEIDLSNAAELNVAIDRARADGPGPLVIDLNSVAFIDSSGLRVLIAVAADKSHAACVFTRPSHAVARVLDIAGLTDRLPWSDGTP